MKYFLYIIKSLKDSNHYTGITSNLNNRLRLHNQGKTKSTKSRRPFILVYQEEFKSREEAREREKYLKSYYGSKDKMTILENIAR